MQSWIQTIVLTSRSVLAVEGQCFVYIFIVAMKQHHTNYFQIVHCLDIKNIRSGFIDIFM